MDSATLVVAGWDTSKSYFPSSSAWESHVKTMLMKFVQKSSPMSRAEAKRIVKNILAREALEIQLVDGRHAHSIRTWLESIGAQVEIFGGKEATNERRA